MKNILQRVKKDRVRFIDLQFSDIDGLIKSVTITTKQLRTALKKGMWFDGSSIEGFTRIAESDMYLKPDINTYAVIPWQSENGATARFICDVYTPDNKPFIGDPRYVLKKVLAEARKMGFIYKTGPELEFFLFDIHNNHIEPLAHDKGSYFDLSMDKAYNIRKEMVNSLEKMASKGGEWTIQEILQVQLDLAKLAVEGELISKSATRMTQNLDTLMKSQ